MHLFFCAPHLLRGTNGQGQVKVEDILFDAGFESKDEALAYGVPPGDTIVPQTETIKPQMVKILSVKLGTIATAVLSF